MPIPELEASGLLPAGLYDCTLDEVEQAFGRFTSSDRRIKLQQSLRDYCSELRAVPLAQFLVVDGSFVTSKPEPGDIDILLALRADADLSLELRPVQYNALSKKRVRQKYPFDLLVAPVGSEAFQRQLDFFAQVKGEPSLRKGLLRVTP